MFSVFLKLPFFPFPSVQFSSIKYVPNAVPTILTHVQNLFFPNRDCAHQADTAQPPSSSGQPQAPVLSRRSRLTQVPCVRAVTLHVSFCLVERFQVSSCCRRGQSVLFMAGCYSFVRRDHVLLSIFPLMDIWSGNLFRQWVWGLGSEDTPELYHSWVTLGKLLSFSEFHFPYLEMHTHIFLILLRL